VCDVTSEPGIELRVGRLENDTESIDELIAEIRSTQQEHTPRFDIVETRLGALETRFDQVDDTLHEVLRRLPDPS
jgi:septation ring formation regulator EzrA